jgi:hypothetical protein
MSKNRMMVLAAVFLSVALIFPVYMIIESWNEDFIDLTHRGELGDQTDIQSYFNDATVRHQTLFTILAAGEVVFVVLLVITLRAIFKSLAVPVQTYPKPPGSSQNRH